MAQYWEANGHAPHPVKYESDAAVAGFPYCGESGLNFAASTAAYSEDDAEYAPGRRNKTSRQDPLSHRIIEKRRRDRMNSCLADLSRLIPPQYQRKGRGRIEKTEIIEMAIRHLKHLQNECVHKEIEYKMGYTDCMKETAKFLYDTQMQDVCYQLLTHLQEHCDEIMKSECHKTRCNVDSISASSGSPPAHNFHPTTTLSQLRDMIPSDVEHSNSNDHNDVKDLSFRSSQPHQAPVITSTAQPSVHHDSSNHDFESSREPICHQENGNITPPPLQSGSLLRTGRMRNISESSHEIEHNNNYKYKNHIKQRFNQDSHLHLDESTGEHSIGATSTIVENSCSTDHPKSNLDTMPTATAGSCKKRKISSCDAIENGTYDEKSLVNGDIKSESPVHHNKVTVNGGRHFTVPIFALHGQGTYYVPLNVDYDVLIPFLHGVDLLDKNFCNVPAMHPINISVNFAAHHPRSQNFTRPKIETIANGW